MSTLAVNTITDANGGNNARLNGPACPDNSMGFRNRIINGDMRIDQRNAGAAVTASGQYTLDRWVNVSTGSGAFTIQQSSTAPTGFVNSMLLTVTTADSSLAASDNYAFRQKIEGFNCADLAWGSASAKTVTISFWVRSSITGTFGGAISNSAVDRSYPFTYTISAADTWEQKTITVAGDTTGTWPTNSSSSIQIKFSIGTGSDASFTALAWGANNAWSATGATNLMATLNATWYVTGVQLEVGSVATPFERRPYGTELSLCQRYYYRVTQGARYSGFNNNTTISDGFVPFAVSMRDSPSALEQSGTAADYGIQYTTTTATCSSVPTFRQAGVSGGVVRFTASGLTAGQGCLLFLNTSGYLAWSAEL